MADTDDTVEKAQEIAAEAIGPARGATPTPKSSLDDAGGKVVGECGFAQGGAGLAELCSWLLTMTQAPAPRSPWRSRCRIDSNEASPQTAEMYGGGSGRRFMTGSGKNQSQWTA